MALAQFRNWIDGRYCEAASGQWLESFDPSRGEVWALVPGGGSEDIDRAVAGREARVPARRRVAQPQRVAARAPAAPRRRPAARAQGRAGAHREPRQRQGGARDRAASSTPSSRCSTTGPAPRTRSRGETVELGRARASTSRCPSRSAWSARSCPGTRRSRCSLRRSARSSRRATASVVKPAEQAACSSLAFARLFDEAGFPPGVVNVVSGCGEIAGDALVRHPDVRQDHLHRRDPAPRARITARSADTLKRLAFELGGKSPNIVFADVGSRRRRARRGRRGVHRRRGPDLRRGLAAADPAHAIYDAPDRADRGASRSEHPPRATRSIPRPRWARSRFASSSRR